MSSTTPRSSTESAPHEIDNDTTGTVHDAHPSRSKSIKPILWRLYISHTLSTWNARMFEFGAVIFLAAIFPGTLFFASCYALFRSAAATIFSSWIGRIVDHHNRLWVVRQSIMWQRYSVAVSCLFLLPLLLVPEQSKYVTWSFFFATVVLACVEKLAFIGNTVSVERDWIIVVSDSLALERQELNSTMRRIDLVCKLIAPLAISLVDGYSTKVAIWYVFAQNAVSVIIEYFAIKQVYSAVPELAKEKRVSDPYTPLPGPSPEEIEGQEQNGRHLSTSPRASTYIHESLRPWKDYIHNPAFLASFSLSLLYLTVLSFGSQMTTYLLSLQFTSTHISLMRLVAVLLELSATCAAPVLMRKIGAVRSGLWFINEQLISVALAIGLFSLVDSHAKTAGGALVVGVALSRLGLWGFDLCVQYLVQEDAPEASRGSFSAIEASLQNLFELTSFATTMIFYRPEDFKHPIYISAVAIAVSAACFAAFVRQKRGHLLHTSKCFRRERRGKYYSLPTIEEEQDLREASSNVERQI